MANLSNFESTLPSPWPYENLITARKLAYFLETLYNFPGEAIKKNKMDIFVNQMTLRAGLPYMVISLSPHGGLSLHRENLEAPPYQAIAIKKFQQPSRAFPYLY